MDNRKYDNLDEYADSYRVIHNNNIKKISGTDSNYFSEYKIIEVLNCEGYTKNNSILDYGCGDGNSAKYFFEYLKPKLYYGIDISNKSIELAKKQKLKNCYFETFDGDNIPFYDETFDIVFIAGVLHHVNKNYHSSILSECRRVLKKGGRLYIFEHNPFNPMTKKIVKDCSFDINAELIFSGNIKKVLKKLQYNKIVCRFTIFFPRVNLFRFFVAKEKYLRWLPLGGQYYIRCIKQ